MPNRKLGRATDQRKAILRNLTTALIWNGKIETTHARALEVRSIAEKLITVAAKEHDKTVEVKKTVKDEDGKKVEKTVINDSPSRLQARRKALSYLYNITLEQNKGETNSDYKERASKAKHPVVEKLFREVAPKYVDRKGGYTRIIKKGPRRGDAAEMVILELV